MSEQRSRSGYSLPPERQEKPALAKWQECLVIFLVLASAVLWTYGIIKLVGDDTKGAGECIGGAALAYVIVFAITRGVVKKRRR